VSYNAFDPKLQLWVAACLYRYYVDMHESLYGPLDDDAADAIYLDARKLGTTLQVREAMWPTDRAGFDEYWKRSLDRLQIDPPVRQHLHGVAALAFLLRRCGLRLGRSISLRRRASCPPSSVSTWGCRGPRLNSAGSTGYLAVCAWRTG
jgi:uncharacterized protein (DUF2236 family)